MLKANGDTIGLDVSALPDSMHITAITWKTNALKSRLLVAGIQAPTFGSLSLGSGLLYDGERITVTLTDLVGEGFGEEDGSVTLGRMRSLFGSYVKVTGKLNGRDAYASFTPYELPVVVKLTREGALGTGAADWFGNIQVTQATGASLRQIRVPVQTEARTVPVSSIGLQELFLAVLGREPQGVRLASGGQMLRYASEKDRIAQLLGGFAAEADSGWFGLTLGDLAGKSLYVVEDGIDGGGRLLEIRFE